MRELVIVVSDLYVSQESPERDLPPGIALPGLQHFTRFGARSALANDWREWVARWADPSHAELTAPATIAAAGVRADSFPADGGPAAGAAFVWMASPLHLVAGLTSLHVDRRSLLRLGADDSAALARDFRRVFNDSGFWLEPLESGDFLLFGPGGPPADRVEPARAISHNVGDVQPVGADLRLRRLGAEIEMWLHEHPINDGRRGRGEPSVTGLWIWGGGPVGASRAAARPNDGAISFGNDAFVHGLWSTFGAKPLPVPPQAGDVFRYSSAQRAVLVLELGSVLHSHPSWTFFDAMVYIDREFLAPVIAKLRAGELERGVLLANGFQFALRSHDRLKFWRRPRPGLSGLQ